MDTTRFAPYASASEYKSDPTARLVDLKVALVIEVASPDPAAFSSSSLLFAVYRYHRVLEISTSADIARISYLALFVFLSFLFTADL